MKRKKIIRDIAGFTAIGTATSMGGSVLSQFSNTQGASQGLQNISSFYPAIGTLKASQWVMGELGGLAKIKYKRKKII